MIRRAHRVLVVEPDLLALHQVASVLGRRDYVVASATTAPQAAMWLGSRPIDLLLASTQIHAVRGVQFVVSARAKHPELAAVLIGSERERGLEMDARRHGFAFVSRPFDPDELLMIVAEQIAGIRRRQRWPRKRLDPRVPVRLSGCDAVLTNVSYGGVGFELAADLPVLPPTIEIDIGRAGLHLEGELVWSAPGRGRMTCIGGIAVGDGREPSDAWRRFVDRN